MKILLASHPFLPLLGGIEVISAILADEFVKAGHTVHVVTQTPNAEKDTFAFAVSRGPTNKEILQLARWCDVYFQNNISLRTLFAGMRAFRPTVVTYQTWIRRVDGRVSGLDWLKAQTSRLVTRNVAISGALAKTIPARCPVIPNPYDHRMFRCVDGVARDSDLVFVGRLVSDKGVSTLLDALGSLARRGVRPRLTIVGSGPEWRALEEQAKELGIANEVNFAGPMRGEALVRMLNAHRVLVVPSKWDEPFGVVALEGIACGCFVIGSAGGGLPEAIGSCGLTFPNGDAEALATAIERALGDMDLVGRARAAAPAHLEKHRSDVIAQRYLGLFTEILP